MRTRKLIPSSLLWLSVSLALAAGPSCSPSSTDSSDDASDASGGKGSGGKAAGGKGSGGKGSGGKGSGGKTGTTGGQSGSDGGRDGSGGADEPGGQGGEGSGGEAAGGVSGATGGQSAGGGGSGGSGAICGDSQLDVLEQCDAGPTPAQGCTEACTLEACDTCRSDAGAAHLDYIANYANCDDTLLGADDKLRCDTVLECIRENDCARDDVRECYCGATDFTECFMPDPAAPQGACKDAMNEVMKVMLGKDPLPSDVGLIFFKRTHPIGVAVNTTSLEALDCFEQCYPDSSGTGGTGSGGASSGGAGSGGAASGGASSGGSTSGGASSGGAASSGGSGGGSSACDTCSTKNCKTVLDNWTTRCTGGICDDYTSCAKSHECAEGDFLQCYCGSVDVDACVGPYASDPSVPQGVCKSEITAIAGTSAPQSVASKFYSKTSPLGASNNLLVCQHESCLDECF